MPKTIKVSIAGYDYTLIGDDENLIQHSSRIVNQQINELKLQNSELTTAALPVLAALNLAEKNYINNEQYNIDMTFLNRELNRMVDYLSEKIKEMA
jgi:cell division protein ZapA (FtsZ GTPase activity inhibitor)